MQIIVEIFDDSHLGGLTPELQPLDISVDHYSNFKALLNERG